MHLKVVTTNDGKFMEFESALRVPGLTLERVHMKYPELQADKLEEVVSFGLDWLGTRVGGNIVIDDSGLFVDSLSGFPGVYSAFVERTIGLGGILKLMESARDRKALFRTVLGILHDGRATLLSGECRGEITTGMRGSSGFGYDPIFIPDGQKLTFGEMGTMEKNAVSHRGHALRRLKETLDVEKEGVLD